MGGKIRNLEGMKFGRLTAIKLVPGSSGKGKHARWICKCDCGNVHEADSHCLIGGNVKSCGCITKDRLTTHGETGTRLYNVWCGMRRRCTTPSDTNYRFYGARGIKVCKEWQSYEVFKEWAVESGYKDAERGKFTLDRIDPNGNYEPSNCRWIDMKSQANNRRNSVILTYNGEAYTLRQWSEKLGICYGTLQWRYREGWSVEEILSPLKREKGQGNGTKDQRLSASGSDNVQL